MSSIGISGRCAVGEGNVQPYFWPKENPDPGQLVVSLACCRCHSASTLAMSSRADKDPAIRHYSSSYFRFYTAQLYYTFNIVYRALLLLGLNRHFKTNNAWLFGSQYKVNVRACFTIVSTNARVRNKRSANIQQPSSITVYILQCVYCIVSTAVCAVSTAVCVLQCVLRPRACQKVALWVSMATGFSGRRLGDANNRPDILLLAVLVKNESQKNSNPFNDHKTDRAVIALCLFKTLTLVHNISEFQYWCLRNSISY